MADLVEVSVLDLKAGDRVHERNSEWPQPFSKDEFYIYTVECVDRVNKDTVHVGIDGGDTTSSISYDAEANVTREVR